MGLILLQSENSQNLTSSSTMTAMYKFNRIRNHASFKSLLPRKYSLRLDALDKVTQTFEKEESETFEDLVMWVMALCWPIIINAIYYYSSHEALWFGSCLQYSGVTKLPQSDAAQSGVGFWVNMPNLLMDHHLPKLFHSFLFLFFSKVSVFETRYSHTRKDWENHIVDVCWVVKNQKKRKILTTSLPIHWVLSFFFLS